MVAAVSLVAVVGVVPVLAVAGTVALGAVPWAVSRDRSRDRRRAAVAPPEPATVAAMARRWR